MMPPVFALANADAAVRAQMLPAGALPAVDIPLWAFGEATQKPGNAYAVWQTVGGAPENYLAGKPDVDDFTFQLDVYATDGLKCRAIAEALRDVYEAHAYVTSWVGDQKDADTKRYRTTFLVDWIFPR